MLELALSIFNSNEPPMRSLEQIRLDRKRQRRERAHRRLVAEAAQRRAERKDHKERLSAAGGTNRQKQMNADRREPPSSMKTPAD